MWVDNFLHFQRDLDIMLDLNLTKYGFGQISKLSEFLAIKLKDGK